MRLSKLLPVRFTAGEADAALREMIAHVERSPPIYRPSKFWKFFEAKNLEQLSTRGLRQFKRTVNQNYFNWVPWSVEDNQFKALLALTAQTPNLDAFNVRLGRVASFQGFAGDNPLRHRDVNAIYRLFLGMLWCHACATDTTGAVAKLSEPKLGSPLPAYLKERLISQDLANSAREFGAILKHSGRLFAPSTEPRIVEIGAGYGRLGYVFLKSVPCRYVIVDIPPALYISQWYLSRLLPEKVVMPFKPWRRFSDAEAELRSADLAFMTPDQYALLPDASFDLGIAISNLAEMTPDQCALYLDLFAVKVQHSVYIKQWETSVNEYDGHSYERSSFDMPAPWRKRLDRLDLVQDRFFETLWRKEIIEPSRH